MADAAVDPAKIYDNFADKVKLYVELAKNYYEKSKNEGKLTEEGEVKLTEADEDKLHEIMIDLIKELLEITGKSQELSKYFAGVSVPHFNTIMESTPFELKAFMGPHFSEDSDDTPKFNSKRKTSARKTSKGRKSGRKTSKGRKSGRKTSKGRKSGRKTSKGRKVRN